MVGNKPRLGISIYPDFYNIEGIKERLDFAKEHGYHEIFTSIQLGNLGFENAASEITEEFKFLFNYAKELKLTCHVDLNSYIFNSLGATLHNLKIIKDLNIPIIRLDGGFNDEEVATLTNNNFGIIIEENLSNYTILKRRIEIVKKDGNPNQYYGCHNFFPHNDTGLAFEEAVSAAHLFQDEALQTGIFISSLSSKNDLNAVGFGVPSIEKHRYLPSEIQLLELLTAKSFDYIIFGDSDPASDELIKVAQANKIVEDVITKKQVDFYEDYDISEFLKLPCLDIPVYFDNLTTNQMRDLEEVVMISRSDKAEKVIRGTQSRNIFPVVPNLSLARQKYNIFIDNNLANRYSGEIHILLEDLPAVKYANYIGVVKPYATSLLKKIHSGEVAFRLRNRKD